MTVAVQQSVDKFADRSFGNSPQWIITSATPSPQGVIFESLYFETNVSGFACTNHKLMVGSGQHSSTMFMGTELFGSFENITVEEGSVIAITRM
jgi:hypothetical protein